MKLFVLVACVCIAGCASHDHPKPETAAVPAVQQTDPETFWRTRGPERIKALVKNDPAALPAFIDQTKREIDINFAADPAARAGQQFAFVVFLLNNAPAFGLVEFEEFEAHPDDLDPRVLPRLRWNAVNAYASEGRMDAARRQIRKVIETATDNDLLLGCCLAGVSLGAPEERAAYADHAAEIIRRTSKDPRLLVVVRMAENNPGGIRAVMEQESPSDRVMEQGEAIVLGVQYLVSKSLISEKDAAAATLAGYSMMKDAATPGELIGLVSMLHDVAPETALAAAALAEQRVPPGDENLRHITRLTQAKILKQMGRLEEVAANFRDIDTNEHVAGGINYDSLRAARFEVNPRVEKDPSDKK